MKISDYNFNLPKELIAQEPVSPRDHARLLVYSRSAKTITDAHFYDLNTYLPKNTTVVLNAAKVDKCRMKFGKIETFLIETVNDVTAKAMVFPGKKFKLGETVELAPGISAEVTAIDQNGYRTLVFSEPLDDDVYTPYRLTPLPPYIEQNEDLSEEYQTVYAKKEGSKAAPTAGLHFTDELLEQTAKLHDVVEVTLDVGLGTFAGIDDATIAAKSLHSESYAISAESAQTLNDASHITAVGTTSARVLESALQNSDTFTEVPQADTDIFIQPGDTLKAVDSLITNFHLPETSLLMLVASLTGPDELLRIYEHAIAHKYRFYSFGDAMLIV